MHAMQVSRYGTTAGYQTAVHHVMHKCSSVHVWMIARCSGRLPCLCKDTIPERRTDPTLSRFRTFMQVQQMLLNAIGVARLQY